MSTLVVNRVVSQDLTLSGNQEVTGNLIVSGTQITQGNAYITAADSNQQITGGILVTSLDLGVISTGTVSPNPGDRPQQHYTCQGPHTLAPSANVGSCILDIIMSTGANTITTSSWTKVSGDSFTYTNGHKFRVGITIGAAGSLLNVIALQ